MSRHNTYFGKNCHLDKEYVVNRYESGFEAVLIRFQPESDSADDNKGNSVS